MTIYDALDRILGNQLSASIIADMGLRWAVVAAMAQATTDDDPTAIRTIRAWNKDQKRAAKDDERRADDAYFRYGTRYPGQ